MLESKVVDAQTKLGLSGLMSPEANRMEDWFRIVVAEVIYQVDVGKYSCLLRPIHMPLFTFMNTIWLVAVTSC